MFSIIDKLRDIFCPPVEKYAENFPFTVESIIGEIVTPFLPLLIAYILVKFPHKKYNFYTRLAGFSLVIIYGIINVYVFFDEQKWINIKNSLGLTIWLCITFVILTIGIKGVYKSTKRLLRFYEKQRERLMGIFGTSGAGKTTYIATLAEMIWNSKAKPEWSLEIPKGLVYVGDVIKTLKRGEWPSRTLPGTREEIELKITEKRRFKNTSHRIFMNDISGEEFERFIKDPDINNLPPTLGIINKCQGFLILIDPVRAEEESYDYHAFLEYLIKIKGLKDKEKLEEFFAFVFTKNDEHNIKNPEKFAKEKMPPLYHPYKLRIKEGRGRFFTCSSVGRVHPDTKKPLTPLEPVGVEEPLEWLIENLKKVTITPAKIEIEKEEQIKEKIKEKEEKEIELPEEKIEKIKICKNCGNMVDESNEKCPECGGIDFEEE